ncbi:unnamed protein product [Caenorhabditis angaria]|uniref:Uncharacterized protein n=1 Tax=Caenorhabditis angaria TaxID=860376 RepID=A0A9P1IDF4_9PELO|nr:unnamed protein product [Caenorhabditis angaria]
MLFWDLTMFERIKYFFSVFNRPIYVAKASAFNYFAYVVIPSDVHIPMKPFKIIEENSISLKIDVNNGEMINEYDYVRNDDDEYRFFNEKQSKCTNKTYSWYSTSLINYDELFKKTAKSLLDEYRRNLNRYEFEDVLDKNYFILSCGNKKLNLEQYKQHLSLLHKNIEVDDISYSKIQQLTVDENREIHFQYDGKTTFNAQFVEKDNRYKLISEEQYFCPTIPVLTFLINDNSTARNIAKNAVFHLTQAIINRNLATVLIGEIETLNCANQKTSEIVPDNSFLSRFSLIESIKQGHLEISKNQLDFSTKTLEFVLNMKRTETGKPMTIHFDVNLENKKFQLKLNECF